MSGILNVSEAKYGKDQPFSDPVVRCDSCATIMLVKTLKELHMCPKCGNRKVRSVMNFSEDELKQMKEWNVDQDFIALFQGVANA